MRAIFIFALPFLLLACHGPEAAPAKRPVPNPSPVVTATVTSPAPAVEMALDPGVESPEALRAEFQEAWTAEMKGSDLSRPQDAPLRIRVTKYRARPATNRFLTLGLPGIGAGGAGWAVLASRSGGAEFADLVPDLVGGALVGVGLVFLTLGTILGSHQAHMDHKRGYAIQQIKVKASLELVVDGDRERWKETYKSQDLSDAAPLPSETAQDPDRVRREMMRTLARHIHLNLKEKVK